MAAGRVVHPAFFPARDRNGRPVSGALMAVRVNRSSSVLAEVFTDEALTTPLINPVVANSSGQFPDVWCEAGTITSPVLYTLAFSGPNGESIGNPAVFDDWQPSTNAAVLSIITPALLAAGLLGSGLSGSYTAEGGESAVTVSEGVVSAWQVHLFRDGIRQEPGTDYTANGTSVLTVTDPLEAGEEVFWVHAGGSGLILPFGGATTPERYGAKGDGTADDRAAWEAAIADGGLIIGDPSATYLISGSDLDITGANIMNARFRDNRTGSSRKTLKASACDRIMLDNVEVDWGADGEVGGLDISAAIHIEDCPNVDLRNVRVTGRGKGAGVRMTNCRGTAHIVIPELIGGSTSAGRPTDDVIQGIHLIDCDMRLLYPDIRNVGTLWAGQASRADAYSRGIAISGGSCDIIAPVTEHIDQHIDISGSLNAKGVNIHGGNARYGRYFGIKVANTGSQVRVFGHRSYRMGLAGYVVSSTNDETIPEIDSPMDVRFVDCVSEEIGYGQAGYAYGGAALGLSAGGKIEVGDEYLTWPRGVQFIRHRVIGGGLTAHSFIDQTSEYDDPEDDEIKLIGNAGPFRNRCDDWKASGCTVSNQPIGFLTGFSKVSMTAPASVPNGGASTTVFTLNQEPVNGMMLLRTSAGAAEATDEVVIRYGGRFLVSAIVVYAANGTGDRRCELGVNGEFDGANRVDQRASDTTETTVRLTTMVTLAAGDTLSVGGFQNSGGALNASASFEITDIKHQTGEVWS